MGNIAEIRENGLLAVKYSYDKIGRLIREDNRKFGKIAVGTIVGAALSLTIGGVVAGIQSAKTGHGFWAGFGENVTENAVDALVTSFAFTAVTIAAGNIAKCIQCFKEGTLVQTDDGLKKIEEIQEGDYVLAYDEKTGMQEYKQVVRLFRNESTEWIGITVNGSEIESTPGHKYYLPKTKEWVSAEKLKVGTKVLLSNGSYGIIEAVRRIHYDEPQTTYNFEVEDFHTYYVGAGVLVHNKNCTLEPGTKEWNQAKKDIKNSANQKRKLNYVVKDEQTALKLMNESGLPFQGEGYIHGDMSYTVGFEKHMIDNDVGLQHFKFWSGRTNGHVYWLNS